MRKLNRFIDAFERRFGIKYEEYYNLPAKLSIMDRLTDGWIQEIEKRITELEEENRMLKEYLNVTTKDIKKIEKL